ncbi:7-keto-8-aminopelargonate synthetase-like enzyme [Thiovulum sp. ES]|nr:7-keto-8-aminopelargonate synthetase-like enzyme [Thiovulum sp. ES]
MYKRELEALKNKGLFRERKISEPHHTDLASNDYLGLSKNWDIFEKSVSEMRNFGERSPKASMLVNGYSQIHKDFEEKIAKMNRFQKGIVFGSGFLANFGVLEALQRKGDELFLDSEYHASGILITKCTKDFQIFTHNSAEDLENRLKNSSAKRKIVAVEGIYSMSGDILNRDIFDIADKYGAILLIDEAHSFGTVGKNLLGVFDYYEIEPKENHIKLGTLGKAVGSYGAYVLASENVISFLENRAKTVIYSTAPSLFETLISKNSIQFIYDNRKEFYSEIRERKDFFNQKLSIKRESLIFPIPMRSPEKAVETRNELLEEGFVVGAIRPPTVPKPILRVIPNLKISVVELEKFERILKEYIV